MSQKRKAEPRYTEEQIRQLRAVLDSQLLTAAALLYPDCVERDEEGEPISDDTGHALLLASALAVDLRDEILGILAEEPMEITINPNKVN